MLTIDIKRILENCGEEAKTDAIIYLASEIESLQSEINYLKKNQEK